jgi:dTMP kinase
MKGIFITFEGVEASGKTSLAEMLFNWLQTNLVPSILTRDPGGTPAGEKIRKLLLEESLPLDSLTEAMLYAAARRQLVAEVIRPALIAGKVVLCDRFSDSFFAYQGFGRGLPLELLKSLNDAATQSLKPNLTFFINIDPEIALKRLKEKDRLEREDLDFHRRVYEGFLTLQASESQRIVLLDGTRNLTELFEEAKEKIAPLLDLPA